MVRWSARVRACALTAGCALRTETVRSGLPAAGRLRPFRALHSMFDVDCSVFVVQKALLRREKGPVKTTAFKSSVVSFSSNTSYQGKHLTSEHSFSNIMCAIPCRTQCAFHRWFVGRPGFALARSPRLMDFAPLGLVDCACCRAAFPD